MANGFDRLSQIYDPLVALVFGRSIRKAQLHYLSEIPPNSRILILGGGTGWLLREVLQQTDPASVVYVDSAEKMIALSRKAIAHLSPVQQDKVEFVCDDFQNLKAGAEFDVVITAFFLDLFTESTLEPAMRKIREYLKPNAFWLFTDFHPPSKGFYKVFGFLLIRIMYLFFWVTCGLEGKKLPPFLKCFERIQAQEMAHTFYYGKIIQARLFSL